MEEGVPLEEDAVIIWWVGKELVLVDMAGRVREVKNVCGGGYKFEFLGYGTGFEVAGLACLCKLRLVG